MAKICEISGTTTQFSNKRSNANNRTRRKVYINLQTKKIYLPAFDNWVKVCASTSSFRTINKKGWHLVFKKAFMQGTLAKRLWPLVG